MITLYLNGIKIETDKELEVFQTYETTKFTKPAAVVTDYSKTVNIPATPNNNKAFGFISNNNFLSATNFNQNYKIDFQLLFNGITYSTGYAVLDDIEYENAKVKSYNITLYGGLANWFSKLQENPIGSLFKNIDINFIYNSAKIQSFLDEPKTIDYIQSHIDKPEVLLQPIFMDTGYYDNFDSNKILLNKSAVTSTSPIPQSITTGGKTYKDYNDWYLVETPRSYSPNELYSLRSHYIPLGVNMFGIFNGILNVNNDFNIDTSNINKEDISKLTKMYYIPKKIDWEENISEDYIHLQNIFSDIDVPTNMNFEDNRYYTINSNPYYYNQSSIPLSWYDDYNEPNFYFNNTPTLEWNYYETLVQNAKQNSGISVINPANIKAIANDDYYTTGSYQGYVAYHNYNKGWFVSIYTYVIKIEIPDGDNKLILTPIITGYYPRKLSMELEIALNDTLKAIYDYFEQLVKSQGCTMENTRVNSEFIDFPNEDIKAYLLKKDWMYSNPLPNTVLDGYKPKYCWKTINLYENSTITAPIKLQLYNLESNSLETIKLNVKSFIDDINLKDASMLYFGVIQGTVNNNVGKPGYSQQHSENQVRIPIANDYRINSKAKHIFRATDVFNMNNTIQGMFIYKRLEDLTTIDVSHPLQGLGGTSMGSVSTGAYYGDTIYIFEGESFEEENHYVSNGLLFNEGKTSLELLLSIANMFNWHFVEKDKTVYIYSYNKYYKDKIVDFTGKLDYSSYKVQPSILEYASLEYGLETLEDSYADYLYTKKNDTKYGSNSYKLNTNISTDTYDMNEKCIFKLGIPYTSTSELHNEPVTINTKKYASFELCPNFDVKYYNTLDETTDKTILGAATLSMGTANQVSPIKSDYTFLCCFDKEYSTVDYSNMIVLYNGTKTNIHTNIFNDKNWYIYDNIGMTDIINSNNCHIISPVMAKTSITDPTNHKIGIQTTSLPVYTNLCIVDGKPFRITYDNNDSLYKYYKIQDNDTYNDNNRILKIKAQLGIGNDAKDLMRQFYYFDNSLWRLNKLIDYSPLKRFNSCEFIKVYDKNNFID